MDDVFSRQEALIEAALLTADEYLTERELQNLFDPLLTEMELNQLLNNLQNRWKNRGLSLINQQNQWRFIVTADFFEKIPHLQEEKNPKYSKAVLETLAIIAYKQPVTRSEIENIRGVSVSTSIMQILTERVWIDIQGYKDSIGKPALWGTTEQFLLDFQLNSLQDLPPLEELEKLIDHQAES
ncbi:SMC-Scp complex subunit ScpB [Neisseriaceae bacterium PsAf]|nr:SMC-Scp complex subunit ScpB [Neisseriaceae bacterium PsAf]MCV2502530.1 SMC-Scp complex subunit ScpB [Neisseriaceae bacterium]